MYVDGNFAIYIIECLILYYLNLLPLKILWFFSSQALLCDLGNRVYLQTFPSKKVVKELAFLIFENVKLIAHNLKIINLGSALDIPVSLSTKDKA